MSKVKPCPFCGRAPKETHREASPDREHKFVYFFNCHGGGYTSHAHVYGVGKTNTEAYLDAERKWNTREDIS